MSNPLKYLFDSVKHFHLDYKLDAAAASASAKEKKKTIYYQVEWPISPSAIATVVQTNADNYKTQD